MPRTELPLPSTGGENVAKPSWPGTTTINPPETPLLAGSPTVYSHSPAPSYIPHDAMTARAAWVAAAEIARTPVTGLTPPFARVAAMVARSTVVAATEHWPK